MKPALDINATCLCSAQRRPYELQHEPGCRWRPMSAFGDADLRQLKPGPDERIAAAVERARAERDARGPGSGGHG